MVLTRKQKRFLSRLLNKGEAYPQELLEFPITGERRRLCIDGDTVCEYGLLGFDEDWTDEEIGEWFEEHMAIRIPSWMYWDCTGCAFTQDIRWHRNPCGLVSFVHRIGYDV